jgi:hypothetical protein
MLLLPLLVDYDISSLKIVKFENFKAQILARDFKFENLSID